MATIIRNELCTACAFLGHISRKISVKKGTLLKKDTPGVYNLYMNTYLNVDIEIGLEINDSRSILVPVFQAT